MLGRTLGNYHVVSKIGEGGMGAVYLARHVTLGRQVAIKVLHPSLSSNQDMVSRFFNEARAATAVRNPSIVEVFDFGVLEDRSAYIVMEYLEGENLGARIRRGRMSVAATMTIVRAITRALQAAHEQNIVHRDLKPDNVFLVPDAELASGERIKLLDFGIAKLAPISGEVSQTRTGMVMGTPTYMAPEQCRGAGSVDHRADLYALGCVAYQMMCGRPPFVSDGAGDLIARHLYFAPEPMRTLCPDIPPDIDHLVLWLLQKDPAARPASAADLVREIDRLAAVSGAAVLQTQPPTRFTIPGHAPVAETTMRGAASAISIVGKPPAPRRTVLLGGAAIGVVAAAAIAIVLVRGHGDSTAGSVRLAAAAPADRDQVQPPAPPPPASSPPATPAPAPPQPAPAAAAPPAPSPDSQATLERPERPEHTGRGDRKKHPSSAARVAEREAEAAPTAAVEARPAAPPPAPVAPVAPPAPPPPAEASHAVPQPVAVPQPAAPKGPPMVSATAVSKRSGAIPAIKSKGDLGDSADVVAKLCIDSQGVVSSVKIIKAPPQITGELSRGLHSWRYEPYVNPAGVQTEACFPVSFRVLFKS